MEQINGWTIIKKYTKDKKTYCICRCKCGKEYERRYECLKQSPMCRSCSHIKHGKYGSKLYFVWAQMKGRCSNKKNKEYQNYGARGIFVCEEWRDSYECFYNWAINNGYKIGLSIDRIDNNDGYRPKNCRWVNAHIQNANKRSLRNTSGVKGVYVYKNGRKHPYQAYVSKKTIGFYDTLEEAKEARKNYLIKNSLTEYLSNIKE